MKRLMLILATLIVPALSFATLTSQPDAVRPIDDDRAAFTSFSKTSTLEWGCPVADRVFASSKAEAISQVRRECLEQAHNAAAKKPEVVDVLQTKVVWPDVQVLELADGYHLSGTFFLETTVVERMTAEAH